MFVFGRLSNKPGPTHKAEVDEATAMTMFVKHVAYDVNKLDHPIARTLVAQAVMYSKCFESLYEQNQPPGDRDYMEPILEAVAKCNDAIYRASELYCMQTALVSISLQVEQRIEEALSALGLIYTQVVLCVEKASLESMANQLSDILLDKAIQLLKLLHGDSTDSVG